MTRSSGVWILLATILGSSMVFIDTSVVNVALPAIQLELNATATGIQWVVESYALFLAALMLVGGAMGDMFGRKRVFALGIVIFALASAWSGFAPNITQLTAARAVQGIGGALLTPGSLAIIRASFSEEQQGQAIGLWSGFSAITAAFGPVMGGWLVQHASWRWVFFINIPLAIIVLVVSQWHVPESCNQQRGDRLDWPGALLATTGLGALVYGLIESNNLGLGNPIVLGTVISGIAALIAFIFVEAHSPTPMMPLGLFRSRTFSGTNLLTFLLYAALSGTLFFFPFNLISVQGYSPTAAGAALLPFTLLMFLLSRWSGGLVHRYGSRLPLVVGPLIAAAGFLLFARVGLGGSYWTTFFPAVLVLGLGMSITVAPLTTAVLGAVEESHAGTASGINNAVSRLAGLMAIAVLSIFLLQAFNHNLNQRLDSPQLNPEARRILEQQRNKFVGIEIPGNVSNETRSAIRQTVDEAFVFGFRLVMLIGSGLAITGAFCALLLVSPRGKADQPDKQEEKHI
ncbi:MAG TPA: MFS transporter [Ktedonobacteraceae bacterium]|nr:MFS transporter [Ktedonobacteraceae bacterium]